MANQPRGGAAISHNAAMVMEKAANPFTILDEDAEDLFAKPYPAAAAAAAAAASGASKEDDLFGEDKSDVLFSWFHGAEVGPKPGLAFKIWPTLTV